MEQLVTIRKENTPQIFFNFYTITNTIFSLFKNHIQHIVVDSTITKSDSSYQPAVINGILRSFVPVSRDTSPKAKCGATGFAFLETNELFFLVA